MKMHEKIHIFDSFIYDITRKHKLFHFFLCALVLLDFSVSKTLIMTPILYFMYLLGSNWDFHQKYGGHLGKWRLEKKLGKFRPSTQNFLMTLDVQKHKNKVSRVHILCTHITSSTRSNKIILEFPRFYLK